MGFWFTITQGASFISRGSQTATLGFVVQRRWRSCRRQLASDGDSATVAGGLTRVT